MNVIDRFRLDGQTAVVTGAARGLGEAMAIALSEAGADVVVVDVLAERAAKTAEVVRENGVRSTAVEADITDEPQIEALTEQVLDEYGGVDILVNNAGVGGVSLPRDVSLEEWNEIIETNLTGTFLCCKHLGDAMIETDGGRIVNISSMSGFIANHPQSHIAYTTSKAGVAMLTRNLASEWAEHGIRLNAIAPGYMRTAMTEEAIENHPEWHEYWLSILPAGRLGRPDELGGIVVFLASEASSYMTGEILMYDGGFTIR